MPRYNVEFEGKWACFSGITDSWITKFMDKPTYEKWRLNEYGKQNYLPAEKCNQKELNECAFIICLNRSINEAKQTMYKCGLATEICDNLINNAYAMLDVDKTL